MKSCAPISLKLESKICHSNHQPPWSIMPKVFYSLANSRIPSLAVKGSSIAISATSNIAAIQNKIKTGEAMTWCRSKKTRWRASERASTKQVRYPLCDSTCWYYTRTYLYLFISDAQRLRCERARFHLRPVCHKIKHRVYKPRQMFTITNSIQLIGSVVHRLNFIASSLSL